MFASKCKGHNILWGQYLSLFNVTIIFSLQMKSIAKNAGLRRDEGGGRDPCNHCFSVIYRVFIKYCVFS